MVEGNDDALALLDLLAVAPADAGGQLEVASQALAVIRGAEVRYPRRYRWLQLRRSLARCDRYAETGPRPRAGLEELVALMVAHHGPDEPASIAYFAGELDRLSKAWRRERKPRRRPRGRIVARPLNEAANA